MERLLNIKNQVSSGKYVKSALDYLNFDDYLTNEEQKIRKELRKVLESEVLEQINDFIEKAQFPEFVIEVLRKVDIMKHFVGKPFGSGARMMLQGILALELSRIDGSLATFVIVQAGLAMFTIESLGSEEQKKSYLPKMINLDCISGWGLTEREIGSDASNLKTTSTKNEQGYSITGNKRWIGNGNRDIVCVWARDAQSKKINCFIVNQNSNGVKYEVIKNKFGLRGVQNCQIEYNNVQVKESDKLVKAIDWNSTQIVLKHSRLIVAWVALGVLVGCYDHCMKYVMNRNQFGIPVAGYQLIQERLTRMMGDIQSCIYYVHRVTVLFQQGKASMGQIALCKATVTRIGREVSRIARESLGGNGIIHQHYLIKAINDIETMYTFEGTYDINSLIVGRELTGLSAFKNSAHTK